MFAGYQSRDIFVVCQVRVISDIFMYFVKCPLLNVASGQTQLAIITHVLQGSGASPHSNRVSYHFSPIDSVLTTILVSLCKNVTMKLSAPATTPTQPSRRKKELSRSAVDDESHQRSSS